MEDVKKGGGGGGEGEVKREKNNLVRSGFAGYKIFWKSENRSLNKGR